MDSNKTLKLISIWFLAKSVLNLIIGFSFSDVVTLLLYVGIVYLFKNNYKYANFIAASYTLLLVVTNIGENLHNGLILYIIEAVVDIIAIWQLIGNKGIKDRFK